MQVQRHPVLTIFQIAAAVAVFWVLFTWKTPWNAARYLGTAFAIIGVGGVFLARYQLGKSFSVTPRARQLVTNGLYSKIRNPIYVFGALLLTGLILVLQKPFLWPFLVIIVIMQTIRAHKEARVLEAAFGDAYREYRRKTWF